jgi:hypothetical protein
LTIETPNCIDNLMKINTPNSKLLFALAASLVALVTTIGFAAVAPPKIDQTCADEFFGRKCPYITSAGLPCMGIPSPAGYQPGGQIWKCSYGHKWVE